MSAPANELHSFNLATLSDHELRALAPEMGVSFEMLRELRFVERFGFHGLRYQSRPSTSAIEELIERQRGGIRV